MKAVEPMFRNTEKKGVIIHNNVVELPKLSVNRRFKCSCCKKEWIETINSPQVLDDKVLENLNDYYGDVPMQTCYDYFQVIKEDLEKEGITLEKC